MPNLDKDLREIWKIVLDSVHFNEQEATEKALAYVTHLRSRTGEYTKESTEVLVHTAVAGVRAALDEVRKDAES